MLKGDVGPELRANVEDLIHAARDLDEQLWAYMKSQLDTDLKRRLLALPKHQEMLKQKDGENSLAYELGLTRATVFTWKSDPELRDLFPRSARRRR